MTLTTLLAALDTMVSGVNDGATPIHNHYYDHCWVGMPEKIPMGDKTVGVIEVVQEPEFHYKTCGVLYDVEIDIYTLCKGSVETAHSKCITVTTALKTAIVADQKFSNNCDDSMITRVIYGEMDVGKTDKRHMVAVSKLTLLCKMSS
jgi:hypothetical protein